MRSLSIALAGTLAMASCGDRDKSPAPTAQPQPQRRSIEPPAGTVRQLPPYGIDAAGIGPYKLRQRLAAILDQLPSGPRIERYEIPSVLHTSLIRAEDDHVLIGGEPTATVASSTTAFVAVIDGDVARTESGVHVGTS
ncbi:MAG TPA: hypothetical protein VFQ53_26085, partial [Kofleriaceae bacterium]|nr:hypothetical protein [Kofleriaceae bacterium]